MDVNICGNTKKNHNSLNNLRLRFITYIPPLKITSYLNYLHN
jgi:hypothetical protein